MLKAFLLRVDESEAVYNRTFPRTPAFAWRAVPRAKRYEFELSTSKTFSEGAVLWSSATAKVDVPTPAPAYLYLVTALAPRSGRPSGSPFPSRSA